MAKVFINGGEGTTGLKIKKRLSTRKDIELLDIPDALRKDKDAVKERVNESDITVLCLPDDAAREAVMLVENPNVRIVDASTAHRTESGWAYGFPELGKKFKDAIRTGKRVAVPGCHASGFLALVYPLIELGILNNDYPLVCSSLTGYSGGGKKMIAEYENPLNRVKCEAPRLYALGQEHKHLEEMQKIAGLIFKPLFVPAVSSFFSGMAVTVPLYTRLLNGATPEYIHKSLADFYSDGGLVSVMPLGSQGTMIPADCLSGKNTMEIFVSGKGDRVLLTAVFDNLGKGASGAALQCINIMLGLDESAGLI